MFNSNNSQAQDRFFPAPPEAVFTALTQAIEQGKFKIKSTDDFSKVVAFSSGASMFTWGENFSAQVIPAEGGAGIRVTGVGKVGGQLQQASRTNKLLEQVLADTTNILRSQVGR